MFWLCKKAIPHMEAGATIINASSVQAVKPSPELLDYATTKAGIHSFTKALAQESWKEPVCRCIDSNPAMVFTE
jgi:NAD(P)-dependent dehydrogenase (short-subunit alcohol dehydrogenase family)